MVTEMRPSQDKASVAFPRPPIKVTFDTSTLDGVVFPEKKVREADYVAYQAVHNAVKGGQIRGFFSEAVVTLDAIPRKAKAEVLGAARIVSETVSTGPYQVTISVGPRWQRIDIDSQILMRIEAARAMGMRALIGPRRFGDTLVARGFGEDFYEPYPPGAAFIAAAETANGVSEAIVTRGLGRALIRELAKSFSERDGVAGEWWPQGLERTRNSAERKQAQLYINEWADCEAIAAHAGYRNDLFCSNDAGRDLRDRSIFHPTNRAWLLETHRVTIVSIIELAERLMAEHEGRVAPA